MRVVDNAGDKAMLHIVEGKLASLTHDVLTLRMEWIPIVMPEHVMGVPPYWLLLLRKVSMDILCYREAMEIAADDEAKELP